MTTRNIKLTALTVGIGAALISGAVSAEVVLFDNTNGMYVPTVDVVLNADDYIIHANQVELPGRISVIVNGSNYQ